MKRVSQEPTPLEYINDYLLSQIDFHDTFVTTNHKNSLNEIAHLIFDNPPEWIKWLFSLRNNLVKLVGLKSNIPADYNALFTVGGYIGFFRIYSISDTELVLGADDSHLNFRAIVVNNHEYPFNIKVITLVKFNNLLGKIYMRIIAPFHRLVVKRMVTNAFRMEKPSSAPADKNHHLGLASKDW